MPLSAYDLTAGLFVRELTNLKALLTKAEAHAVASGRGEAALLDARLASEGHAHGAAPNDLHAFTLAAQVHWAAEGARLAVARLLGEARTPAPSDEKSFADLHRCLDAAIAYLRDVAPGDLEAGLARAIVLQHPRSAMNFRGDRFVIEYAIPHFHYHVTTAYGILRNQGVPLTMGDFLGMHQTG